MKRTIFACMATAIVVFGITAYAATTSFTDVSTSDWFYEDVMNMAEWDVIRGYPDGTFGPGNNVNRAELSAMWNRYDNRVQELVATNGEVLDGNSLTEKTDFALFLLVNQQGDRAYLYGELAAVSSMLFYEIEYPTDLSCNAYQRYYNSAKDQIDAASVINDSIETDELKKDFTEYNEFLSDFRSQYPDCNFT